MFKLEIFVSVKVNANWKTSLPFANENERDATIAHTYPVVS